MFRYHCPKCFSNKTRRAILLDSFDKLQMPNGEVYRPEYHGSPYVCDDCHNVFAVGIEKMTYAEHIDKIREENNVRV
jgi:hypothetical protein